jgi:hypothetical protein
MCANKYKIIFTDAPKGIWTLDFLVENQMCLATTLWELMGISGIEPGHFLCKRNILPLDYIPKRPWLESNQHCLINSQMLLPQ